MEKVGNMQEKLGNVSKGIDTLRNNQKDMLGIKNTVAETINAFDGLIDKCFWWTRRGKN